jgi:hypothetical protein
MSGDYNPNSTCKAVPRLVLMGSGILWEGVLNSSIRTVDKWIRAVSLASRNLNPKASSLQFAEPNLGVMVWPLVVIVLGIALVLH